MTHTTDPILVSHKGKLAHLHGDGLMTDTSGTPIVDPIEKPQPRAPKRWHDPYA
jgi:hypothetical protein